MVQVHSFLPWTAGGIKCKARTHDSSVSLQHPVQRLVSFACILSEVVLSDDEKKKKRQSPCCDRGAMLC